MIDGQWPRALVSAWSTTGPADTEGWSRAGVGVRWRRQAGCSAALKSRSAFNAFRVCLDVSAPSQAVLDVRHAGPQHCELGTGQLTRLISSVVQRSLIGA